MNAGGGDGAECYITNRSTVKVKTRQGIVANEYLQSLRKSGRTQGELKSVMIWQCSGVPVLVEGGFVDNKTDRKLFNTKTKQHKHIARGITE